MYPVNFVIIFRQFNGDIFIYLSSHLWNALRGSDNAQGILTYYVSFSSLCFFFFPTVKSRKPSLGDLILRHTNSPTRARHAAQLALAHVRDGGQSLHSALFRGGAASGASGLEKQAEALRVKNAVYCAVVFSEFLKELAALAQEHAVALPFPPSQGTEE